MVDILLASYNGDKYIADQIDSILNQTYKDWFLYINDDCSTDSTLEIALQYENKYKEKIKVSKSSEATGSAKNNFFNMFRYSKSDYVMTCDQDDVWLPDKIEITYKKMKEAELEKNNLPILIHTDLKVVDENLNLISNSLMKMQNLDSTKDKINNLLAQNIVTGCTVMINRNLFNYIKETPKNLIMHDWWLALIASALGKIAFIETPTVLYRQHDDNGVGAKDVNSSSYILKRLGNIKSIRKSLFDTYIQAGELLTAIGDYSDRSNYDIINQYASLLNLSKVNKIYILKKYGFWKNSIIRILGQILFC